MLPKQKLLWILIFLIVSATVLSVKALRDLRPKHLYVDRSSWDFGRLNTDEEGVAVFNLENRWIHPLVISRVHTSCGCAKAEIDDYELSPGETTCLKVRLKKRRAEGAVKKDVYISYGYPETPVTFATRHLMLTARITNE